MVLPLAIIVATMVVTSLIIYRPLTGGDPAMPSTMAMRRAVARAVRLYYDGDRLMELGSGWGGMARHMAVRFPHIGVAGVEIALVPWLFSAAAATLRNRTRPGSSLRFKHAGIETLRLADDTAYICYLSPASMRKLRRQFERDRPRDGVLISCAFAMPGWTPSAELRVCDALRTTVYVYRY